MGVKIAELEWKSPFMTCIQWRSPLSFSVSPPRSQSSPELVFQTHAVSPSAQAPSWTVRNNGKKSASEHCVTDIKSDMDSFLIREPLRSIQSLLSPRPERAEL